MQQTQSLALHQVLSPQLQQSLLILQTPLLELRNLVQQEMETNPVLEELPEETRTGERGEAEPSADDNFDNEFQKLASLDEEWRDYMAQSASYNFDGSRNSREAQDKRQFLFDSIPVQDTLQQNLIGQLNQSVLSAGDRNAAELIIGNIDDNGFLQSTPEEIALNSGIPTEDFEKMLALIQGFYPAGVGARDLRECLLIQLQRQGKENTLEYTIVSEAFRRSRAGWGLALRTFKGPRTTLRGSILDRVRFSLLRRKTMCCPMLSWKRWMANIRSA